MKSLTILNECGFSQEQIDLLKSKFSDFKNFNDTKSEFQAIKRIGNSNIIVMDQFLWTFDEKLLKSCKNLELIIINTTAFDRIPIDLLKKYKIEFRNLKVYASKDVAEIAISMLMYLNSNIDLGRMISNDKNLKISGYLQSEITRDIWPGHPITDFVLRKPISQQKVGIVGLGNIGQEIALICKKLGTKIIAYNRTPRKINGIELVTLDRLFSESDSIFIALRYDPKTMKKFISKNLLEKAKNSANLISIAPSELIDIDFLIKNPNKFRGLGFDYFVTDKLIKLSKIRKYNTIITPHMGHQSKQAYSNLTNSIINEAISFSKLKTSKTN